MKVQSDSFQVSDVRTSNEVDSGSHFAAAAEERSLLWSLSTPDERRQLAVEHQWNELISSRFVPLAQNEQAFNDLLESSFGAKYDTIAAEELRQQIIEGDTRSLPRIQLINAEELHGAHGAYSEALDTIFLDHTIVGTTLGDQTLIEEFGHAIDKRINSTDTAGDEGALFRLNAGSEHISSQQLSRIKAEDDTGTITVNGQMVAVEFRGAGGYSGADYPWDSRGIIYSGTPSTNKRSTDSSDSASAATSEDTATSGGGYTGPDYPWNPGGVAMGGGPEPVTTPMTARRALTIVDNNFDIVDGASVNGETDGIASTKDLEHISSNSADYPANLVEASDYLITHPEVFGIMEVLDDDDSVEVIHGRQTQLDGKFSSADVNIFLDAQVHIGVIYENADAIDISQTGGEPDGILSDSDFEEIVHATDSTGDFVYTQELRDAAQFVLDNERVFDVLDTSAPRGTAPDISFNASASTNWGNGQVSTEELNHTVIQMQVFADNPQDARDFVLNGSAVIDGLDVSDERSVSDEGMRALTAAALTDTDTTQKIDIISALPETNRGLRNELITATYAELGLKLDEFLGEESGANWAIWGVPASTKVGEVIRNEQSIEVFFTNNGATGKQRALMAEGNLLLFTELAPHLNSFHETFGNDQVADQQKLDDYLDQFGTEQQGLAEGFRSYYQARFTDNAKEKQELTLLGNYHLVIHEQSKIDPILDQVLTDLPFYADAFNFFSGNYGSDRANDAVVVEYPGRGSTSVSDDVPAHDASLAAYENQVVFFADIQNPEVRQILEDSAASNESRPDSRANTFADDWHEFEERMFYIFQDWRLHHTDQGLFELAATSGYSSVDLS